VERITGCGVGTVPMHILLLFNFELPGLDFVSRAQLAEQSKGTETAGKYNRELSGAIVYLVLVLAFGFTALSQSMLFAQLCNSSGRVLHERLLARILRAPIRFFQVNTPGRVLNRLVNDMSMIDEFLQLFYRNTLRVKVSNS